jgi:hypothetical protein
MTPSNQGRGNLARFSLRTIALIVGLIGTIIALIIALLYSVFHLLGRVAGVTDDSGHFLLGLLVVLMGVSGSFLAPILPLVAAALLAIAGIAFFFAVGWWALLASPFLLVAAGMTLSNRRVNVPLAS